MDFEHLAGCAGFALALVVLQQLLFDSGLRSFVAEERKKRAETAAQMLRPLEESLRQPSPTTKRTGTDYQRKISKTTSRKNDHAVYLERYASSSTSERAAIASLMQRAVDGKKSTPANDVYSTKLTPGCSKRAGSSSSFLPRSSIANSNERFSASCGALSGQVVAISRWHRQWETMPKLGRPKIRVSSGSLFYSNVVQEMARANGKEEKNSE